MGCRSGQVSWSIIGWVAELDWRPAKAVRFLCGTPAQGRICNHQILKARRPRRAFRSMKRPSRANGGLADSRPLNHILVRPSFPLKSARNRMRYSIDITATGVELEGKVCRSAGTNSSVYECRAFNNRGYYLTVPLPPDLPLPLPLAWRARFSALAVNAAASSLSLRAPSPSLS